MRRCVQLARNGLGSTYPNPLVGSVIVSNDNIIGEGWHQRAGEAHAEVQAINSVKDKEQLKNAAIYINLEPCSHFGKTPPCSDLIIRYGIKTVIIGNTDPNPLVSGSGIQKLREAGCHVLTGVLEDECYDLNKRFFTFHIKKRPYIILKWAETLDGFIAPNPSVRKEKSPVWITNPCSLQLAHKLRSREMAILVGTTTASQDNPSLTTRHWAGKNPVRIVIDKDLKLSKELSIFNQSAETIVITQKDNIFSKGVTGIKADFSQPLAQQISAILYKEKIQSLIVEGGTKTIQNFIDENLWDEALIFTGEKTFEDGIDAPKIQGKLKLKQNILSDVLHVYENIKN